MLMVIYGGESAFGVLLILPNLPSYACVTILYHRLGEKPLFYRLTKQDPPQDVWPLVILMN